MIPSESRSLWRLERLLAKFFPGLSRLRLPVVFSLVATSLFFPVFAHATATILHAFGPEPDDGAFPTGRLLEGDDGHFYGTTPEGGHDGCGVVFRVDGEGQYLVLHSMVKAQDGCGAGSGVVFGADGAMYGTAPTGGESDGGTVFRITAAGEFSVLVAFPSPGTVNAPVGPRGRLALGPDEAFYGVADGLLYRLTLDGETSVLHHFTPIDGPPSPFDVPISWGTGVLYGPVFGPEGSLYGVTGTTVYRVGSDGSDFETLHFFEGGLDGWVPSGPLVPGDDGMLYGMTRAGGAENPEREIGHGKGVLFRVSPDGEMTILHRLPLELGASDAPAGERISEPLGGLVQSSNGDFYGTAGRLFRMTPSGDIVQAVGLLDQSFLRPIIPISGVVEGRDNRLYGTASGQEGSIFRTTATVFDEIPPEHTDPPPPSGPPSGGSETSGGSGGGSSSGGCSLATGSPFDPTLPFLTVMAVVGLYRRNFCRRQFQPSYAFFRKLNWVF